MDVKLSHPLAILFNIHLTDLGMFKEERLVQPLKISTSNIIKFWDRTTVLKFEQFSKVPPPTSVTLSRSILPNSITEFGISMEVKPVHPANDLWPIYFTEFGMTNDFKLAQSRNAKV